MATITMKELLEAGVHFGHQTKRWNPKMKEYIFGERNGIYIIDLQKTLKMFKEASKFVQELAADGKIVLFVGTKRQAQDAIAEEATKCGGFYINQRWLGGLLTNWITVQKSVKRLKELDEMATDGRYELLPKKEVIKLERERKHLQANLAGIKNMSRLPDAVFVIDSNKEQIAVREARKLGIPVVAVSALTIPCRLRYLKDFGKSRGCPPDGLASSPGNQRAVFFVIFNRVSQLFFILGEFRCQPISPKRGKLCASGTSWMRMVRRWGVWPRRWRAS